MGINKNVIKKICILFVSAFMCFSTININGVFAETSSEPTPSATAEIQEEEVSTQENTFVCPVNGICEGETLTGCEEGYQLNGDNTACDLVVVEPTPTEETTTSPEVSVSPEVTVSPSASVETTPSLSPSPEVTVSPSAVSEDEIEEAEELHVTLEQKFVTEEEAEVLEMFWGPYLKVNFNNVPKNITITNINVAIDEVGNEEEGYQGGYDTDYSYDDVVDGVLWTEAPCDSHYTVTISYQEESTPEATEEDPTPSPVTEDKTLVLEEDVTLTADTVVDPLTMSVGSVSIVSNKPSSSSSPWEYYEDTMPLTYTITILRDDSLPVGSMRNININTNPFNNPFTDCYYIKEYPNQKNIQIRDFALSSDKQSVTYKIANSAIPDSGLTISIALAPNVALTTYHLSSGTPGQAIGLWLLKDPNQRLGASVTDDTLAANEDDVTEIFLKKDNNQENYLIPNGTLKAMDGTDTTYNRDSDLWLGVDGYIHAGSTSNFESTAVRIYLNNETHTPVGNISIKIPLPVDITESVVKNDTVNGYKYLQIQVGTDGYMSGTDLAQGLGVGGISSTSYQLSTSLDSKTAAQLAGSVPAVPGTAQQWFSIRMTGGSSYAPRAEKPIYMYTNGSELSGAPITGTYQQVEKQSDGTYATVNKEIELGNIVIHVPDFTQKERFQAYVGTPVKVNADDDPDTDYSWQITNNWETGDVQNNFVPIPYSNGTFTIEIPEEFTPESISGFGTANYTSYHFVYEDGTESSERNISSTLYPIPNESGSRVAKIEVTISDRGLVGVGQISTLSNSFSMKGKFDQPASGDKITMPVTVKQQDGSNEVTKNIVWTYQGGADNIVLAASHYNYGYSASVPFFLNNATSNDNTASYTRVYFLSNGASTQDENTASSIRYNNVNMVFSSDTALLELIASISYSGSTSYYRFYGDTYFELTTSIDPNPRRVYFDASTGKTVNLGLVDGEYLESLSFHADAVKLFASNAPSGSRYLFTISMRNDRNIPSGIDQINSIEDTPNYNTLSIKMTTDNADLTNVVNSKERGDASDKWYFCLNKTLDLYAINKSSLNNVSIANTASRNNVVSGTVSVYNPIYRQNFVGTNSGLSLYPEGTKMYLQLNTPYFQYVGQSPYISTQTINNKTYVVVDLSGQEIPLSTNSAVPFRLGINSTINSYTFPEGSFLATNLCEDTHMYQLFNDDECYIDAGPALASAGDVFPYVKYNPSSLFKTNSYTDDNGLTASSGVTYTDKRLVKLNVTSNTLIVAATIDSINLFPGLDTTDPPSSVINGVHYKANEYNNLVLSISIASAEKNYHDYNLAIELPTANVRTENAAGASGTSANSIRLRDGNSVILPDVYSSGATISYCSNVTFDENDFASSAGVCTVESDPTKAKYVYIHIPKVLIGSDGTIQLNLIASEDDMYALADGSMAYANAKAKYFEQLPDQPISTYAGMTDAKNLGKFTFDWYEMSGKIFVDSVTKTPNGLYEPSTGDFTNWGYSSTYYMRFKDYSGSNKIFNITSFKSSTGVYTVKIQPRATEYSLAFDLKNGSPGSTGYYFNNYRITVNTSSDPNKAINNNMPRQYNDQTAGMKVTADVNGFTGSADVTTEEIENGQVNVGLYQNPKISFSVSPVRVKVGESLSWTAIIVGQGTFDTANSPYIHIEDEGTYGDFSLDSLSADKKTVAQTIDGTAETRSGTSLQYKDIDYDCINYFNEPFTGQNTYQVYKDPYIMFDKGIISGETTVWADASADQRKEVEISALASATATYGKMTAATVPSVVAPDGYCFAGWKLTRYGSLPGYTSNLGIQDPTTYSWTYKYDLYTAQYEVDEFGDYDTNGDPIGDGIPDKYQMAFRFMQTEGGKITKGSDTIDNETDYFEVIKTKLSAHNTSSLYPLEEYNPSNWGTYAALTFTAAEVPTTTAETNYHFEDWKVTDPTNANFKQILTDANDVVSFVVGSGNQYTGTPKIFYITAEFKLDGIDITFEKNTVGQASQVTETITKEVTTKLTTDDLKDSLNKVRSTPAYGYTFTGWKRIDGTHNEIVATTDADLIANYTLTEEQTLQPQYTPKQYSVTWALTDPISSNPKEDGYGNKVSYVGLDAAKVTYNTTGTSLTVPTTTTSTSYVGLFSFGYWAYSMACDTTAAGCPTSGIATGSVTDPKALTITGDVTFTAVFAAKPYVGITQDGNGTVADAWMKNPSTNPTLTYAATATAIQLHNPPMSAQPVAGEYNVLAGFKSNANYDVDKITAVYVNGTHPDNNPGKIVVYANGTVNSTNIATLQTETGNSTITITAEDGTTPGTIKVLNIGGNDGGTPCGIIFEVTYKLEQRTVEFDPNGGSLDTAANNTAFTTAGGVLPATLTDPATWTVNYNEKVTLFPKVVAPANKAFSYWALSTAPTTPVTQAALANTAVTDDITYIAVFDDDTGGPGGEGETCGVNKDESCGDGIPDKYQIKFTYTSKDTNKGTVTGTTTEYITRAKNADGTYSETNAASPTASVTTTPTNAILYAFNQWEWGATPDTAISNGSLATKSFTEDTEFKADWKAAGYTVSFHIASGDGTLSAGSTLIQDTTILVHQDVLISHAVSDTPAVNITDTNKHFVGWYATSDASETIVDPTSVTVSNADLSFTAKVMADEVTVEDGIAITGEGFTIENNEAAPITKEDVIDKSNAEAWVIETGDVLTPTISDEDLAKIQAVGPEGDIVPVTLIATTTINGRDYTATRDIVVVVKGTTTPGPSGPDSDDESLAITAKGFTLANADAASYDEDVAKTESKVKSYLVKSSTKVTSITPDSDHIDAIKAVGVEGGIFPQKFSSVSGTLNANTTVNVVVEGTHTIIVPTDDDTLVINAHGFALANADAASLTDALAKTKSEVVSKLVVANETLNLADITVDATELSAIQAAGPEGGIYPLTFTATKDGDTVSVTVDVVVEGTEVIEDADAAIKAKDFTVEYADRGFDKDGAITNADVKALIVGSGVDITDQVEVDPTELATINNCGTNGGTFPLTFKVIAPDGTEVTKTINVTVKPKPVNPPVVTPDPGRTCQDDGYPDGYYWNGTACVIDATPTPVVTVTPSVTPIVTGSPAVTPSASPNTTPSVTPTSSPNSSTTPVITSSPYPTITPGPSDTPDPTPDVGETIIIEGKSYVVTEVVDGNIIVQGEDGQYYIYKPIYGNRNSWALFNLIAAAVATILAIAKLLQKSKKDDEADDEKDKKYDANGKEIEVPYVRKNKVFKAISLISAIASIILFILTENITKPMVYVDKYTVIMIVLAAISIISMFLGNKWKEDTDDDDDTVVNQ